MSARHCHHGAGAVVIAMKSRWQRKWTRFCLWQYKCKYETTYRRSWSFGGPQGCEETWKQVRGNHQTLHFGWTKSAWESSETVRLLGINLKIFSCTCEEGDSRSKRSIFRSVIIRIYWIIARIYHFYLWSNWHNLKGVLRLWKCVLHVIGKGKSEGNFWLAQTKEALGMSNENSSLVGIPPVSSWVCRFTIIESHLQPPMLHVQNFL